MAEERDALAEAQEAFAKNPIKLTPEKAAAAEAEDKRKKEERKKMRSSARKTFETPVLPKALPFEKAKELREKLVKKEEQAAKEYAHSHPEAREQLKDIAKKSGIALPSRSQSSKSPQDQLAELQLKKLKQELRPRIQFNTKDFSLPQFTKDNATGIVLACLLIILGLEVGAGSKFTEIWNFAYGTAVAGAGPGEEEEQPTRQVTSGTHFLPANSWGIPDPFEMAHV